MTMVLHDLGHLQFEEPFARFRAHGLIVKDGAKMSKTKGNIVVPDQYISQWGADTFRMYLMFLGPFQEGGDFRDAGINGPRRFLDRVWALVGSAAIETELPRDLLARWHRTKRKVTEDLEALHYNTAIAALMELVNALKEGDSHSLAIIEDLVIMLAPFAPHFAEESWERLGHGASVFEARWPVWEDRLIVEDEIEIPVQVNGKTRSKIRIPQGAEEKAVVAIALKDPTTARFVDNKPLRKVIYVPNRLLNLVV
jgi:leucyl-tRNA synthetase